MKIQTQKNILAAAIVPTILFIAYSLDAGTFNVFKHEVPGLEILVLLAVFAVQFLILDFNPKK